MKTSRTTDNITCHKRPKLSYPLEMDNCELPISKALAQHFRRFYYYSYVRWNGTFRPLKDHEKEEHPDENKMIITNRSFVELEYWPQYWDAVDGLCGTVYFEKGNKEHEKKVWKSQMVRLSDVEELYYSSLE